MKSDDVRQAIGGLRDSILRAVVEERPDTVREGLGIYQNLIKTFVRRLREYGAHYDRRAALLEANSLPGQGWPELSWIQEDYLEILRASFRHPTKEVLGTVLHFPVAVSSVALYEGDYLTFQEFSLRVPEYAYHLASDLKEDGLRAYAVERIWRFLGEFAQLMVSERLESVVDPEQLAGIGEIAEGTLFIFNGLLKQAFDLRRIADFREFLTRMGQLFSEVDVREFEEGGDATKRNKFLRELLRKLRDLEGLIRFGLNAWIIQQYAQGKLDGPAFPDWYRACGTFGDLPHLTETYIRALDPRNEDLLRWEWWALEGTEGAVVLNVDAWFHRAYVLHALNQLSHADPLNPPGLQLRWPRDWQHLLDQGRGALRQAIQGVEAEADRWRSVLNEGVVALATLSQLLDAELAQIRERWRQFVEDADLDQVKVRAFRDAIIEGYRDAWVFRPLVSGSGGDLVLQPAEPGPRARGFNRLLPKEYFLPDTNVFVTHIATDYGQGLARDIDEIALGHLVGSLETNPTASVVDDVRETLVKLRKLGYDPSILVVGSWEAYMAFYPDLTDRKTAGSSVVGIYEGAPVHNLRFRGHQNLVLVADLSSVGEWRQYRVSPTWHHESLLQGELGFSLQGITAATADAALGDQPANDDRPARIKELLQKAQFRLLADAEYQVRDGRAAACLRLDQASAQPGTADPGMEGAP